MPTPTMTVPWDSKPGSFFARGSSGLRQMTHHFEADSLDSAITEAQKRFQHWPDHTVLTVKRKSGGESWIGKVS